MNTSFNDEVDCICSQDGGRSSRAVTRALWGVDVCAAAQSVEITHTI